MKRLIVVAGPTASGKTRRAITLARQYATEIVSCDARQFYSELNIGVARPSPEELASAPHHFIACRSVTQPYNVYDYEHEAMATIERLFEQHDEVVAVGGSGLYIDALIHGISAMPDPPEALRTRLTQLRQSNGVQPLQEMLRELDPAYYAVVDLNNPMRLQRAIEVSITAQKPYSQVIEEYRPKGRPFQVEVEVVEMPADQLRRRIDARVDQMIVDGLADEAAALWPLRHYNTLNTVGYREFFEYGSPALALQHSTQITEQIKLNTWHYAKKQITWCKKHYKERIIPPQQK